MKKKSSRMSVSLTKVRNVFWPSGNFLQPLRARGEVVHLKKKLLAGFVAKSRGPSSRWAGPTSQIGSASSDASDVSRAIFHPSRCEKRPRESHKRRTPRVFGNDRARLRATICTPIPPHGMRADVGINVTSPSSSSSFTAERRFAGDSRTHPSRGCSPSEEMTLGVSATWSSAASRTSIATCGGVSGRRALMLWMITPSSGGTRSERSSSSAWSRLSGVGSNPTTRERSRAPVRRSRRNSSSP